MDNPLTGRPMPFSYEVTISYGNRPITRVVVRTTNEEEAVLQAAKLLKTSVKRIND